MSNACTNHPDRTAVTRCTVTGRSLCEECARRGTAILIGGDDE